MREQMLAHSGLKRPDQFVVLPSNAEALDVFLFCQSQWRISMAGATGLDYTAVVAVISTRTKKRKHQQQLLADVRLIESGALKAMSQAKSNGKTV